jgi:molybdopterin-binding protein
MEISARNKIRGVIRDIKLGVVMAKITVEVHGGPLITSIISRDSVDELKLKPGDEVYAIFKSTEVMIGK